MGIFWKGSSIFEKLHEIGCLMLYFVHYSSWLILFFASLLSHSEMVRSPQVILPPATIFLLKMMSGYLLASQAAVVISWQPSWSLISLLLLRHQYFTLKLQIYNQQLFFFSISLINDSTHFMVGFQTLDCIVREIHFNKSFYQRDFYHDTESMTSFNKPISPALTLVSICL